MARPTHGYVNAAGEKIPGTTTIIGRFKESGGLIQWAYARGKPRSIYMTNGTQRGRRAQLPMT
jgi:hypothetical protein